MQFAQGLKINYKESDPMPLNAPYNTRRFLQTGNGEHIQILYLEN